MTAQIIDPISIMTEVLEGAGYTSVHSDLLTSDALSSSCYVWLSEQPGNTPHIAYANRPAVGVAVYSKDGYTASRRHAYDIQALLADSIGVQYPSGGIHRVITDIQPYRMDLPGMPYNVGRTYAQYSLITSDFRKWL
jgi:hypothetical protein